MNKPNGISDKVWDEAQMAMAGPLPFDAAYAHLGDQLFEWAVTRAALAISKAIEDEREKNQEVLGMAHTALNDWLHVYASDMCTEQQVQDSHKRIWEAGGTMVYVANVTHAISIRSKGEE